MSKDHEHYAFRALVTLKRILRRRLGIGDGLRAKSGHRTANREYRRSTRRAGLGHPRLTVLAPVVAVVALASLICGSPATNGGARASRTATLDANTGGSLTVLGDSAVDAWPGLDPATTPGFLAYQWYPNAIYGNLFEFGPGFRPLPDLATGYKVSDNAKTATITLRRGVTFTDGTPFNASAVKWNIERDLSTGECNCSGDLPIASISTPNSHTVVLHLKEPFSPIIEAFDGTAPNWIVSPTAYRQEGAKQFSVMPVGAGPFIVKSDVVGSSLQLVRNPHYWSKGKPYLNSLAFRLVGTEESGYEALQAGQAQVYLALRTVTLAEQAKKTLSVVPSPAITPEMIQLNTTKAPFNSLKAREAVYYATNPEAINHSLELGQGTVTESGTGPEGRFYEPKVPGYRTYDLAKAKSLVQQIGGLTVNLLLLSGSETELATAVESQWTQAGIHVVLDSETLQEYIQAGNTGSWEANFSGFGSFDPVLGPDAIPFRFGSHGAFSGVRNASLDTLLAKGVATTDQKRRATIYRQVFKLISDNAYAVTLFTLPTYEVTARSVRGPGLTTTAPAVLWEDVSVQH
jgi:peptide/nickel transport system substrate-binding protein